MDQHLAALEEQIKNLNARSYTLLWLEGSHYNRVNTVRLLGNRLVLNMNDNVTKVVAFDRFAVTSVGLQFWSQGHPGVLYKWEQVPLTQDMQYASNGNIEKLPENLKLI